MYRVHCIAGEVVEEHHMGPFESQTGDSRCEGYSQDVSVIRVGTYLHLLVVAHMLAEHHKVVFAEDTRLEVLENHMEAAGMVQLDTLAGAAFVLAGVQFLGLACGEDVDSEQAAHTKQAEDSLGHQEWNSTT